MLKKSICITLFLGLSGCATPFYPGKPVEVEGGFFKSFKQEGKVISPYTMMNHLASQPSAAQEKAKSAQMYYWLGVIPAFAGGYLIGYNLASTSDSKSTNLLAGIGLLAGALVIGNHSNNLLEDAVNSYNNDLDGKKPAKKSALLFPQIINETPGLGLSFSF